MKKIEQIKETLMARQYKWLITGVAGFIGSNILEFLLKNNQIVIGIDDLSTGSMANLNHVKELVGVDNWKNFTFVKGDIRDLKVCMAAAKNVDYVLHQGALGSVPRSIKDPMLSNEVNVSGSINIFWASKEAKVKRIVYASSSSVYGDDEGLPKIESRVGSPLSPYAITKKVNELYAKVFSEQYGIEIVGIRYFNVFGPRQSPDGPYAAVIPKWVNAMLQGHSISIYGDGETSRDFTYVENVVILNTLVALSSTRIEPGTIINGALGDTTSLNNLFNYLRDGLVKIGAKKEIPNPKYEDFRAGDIRHSMANMDKAREIFNYEPLIKVEEGIEKTLKWYVQNIVG